MWLRRLSVVIALALAGGLGVESVGLASPAQASQSPTVRDFWCC